ncbi:MAG TPA: hypothetical protein VME70_16980 [Mycobacteriales bacterium]|nr:hypothetical protein [Mycobacteriales bacterium]
MIPRFGRGRPAHRLLIGTALALATAGLGACGSGSSAGTAGGSATTVPTPPTCTLVAGILGNGPDPDADPVGYAEAQIRPLAAVHPTSPQLARAVSALDSAFRQEFARHASATSKAAVRAAGKRLDALCPGATS